MFAHRGNNKRALELIDEALGMRPVDTDLWVDKVRLLLDLGREDQARIALLAGLEIDASSDALRRLQRQLGS